MRLSEDPFMRNVFIAIFVINSFGILGSAFTFLIYSRKAFEKSAFRIYFKSLACLDASIIFYAGFSLASLILDTDIINNVDVVCKFFYLVVVGTSPNPGWVLVLYSIDQLLRVSMSKRFKFLKTKPFQLKFIIGQSVFHCLSAAYVIKQVEVKPVDIGNNVTSIRCEYPYQSYLPILFYVQSSFIPFVFMIITTILILKYSFRSKNAIQRYNSSTSSTDNCPLNGADLGRPKVTVASKGRELKFAFKSVVFNILYIIFNIPSFSIHLYRGEYYYSIFLTRIKAICFILFCFNFSIHFWIHFFVNTIFRKEVYKLLRIKC